MSGFFFSHKAGQPIRPGRQAVTDVKGRKNAGAGRKKAHARSLFWV